MTPDKLYEQLSKLREEYRRRMNASAQLAQKFAATEELGLMSEHSSESARKQEAFLALNRAIDIVENYFIRAERHSHESSAIR